MAGCDYCRNGRAFFAAKEDHPPFHDYQNAHIEPGTNIFTDTVGREMRFRFCPMCGRNLLNTPDAGGGRSVVFSLLQAKDALHRRVAESKGVLSYGKAKT